VRNLIRKILKEIYSPAGKEYTPGKFVVHKSAPAWRENIELTGLQVSVGEWEVEFVDDKLKLK